MVQGAVEPYMADPAVSFPAKRRTPMCCLNTLCLGQTRPVAQQAHLHRWELCKRCVAVGQLQQRDAHRPDVCLAVVPAGHTALIVRRACMQGTSDPKHPLHQHTPPHASDTVQGTAHHGLTMTPPLTHCAGKPGYNLRRSEKVLAAAGACTLLTKSVPAKTTSGLSLCLLHDLWCHPAGGAHKGGALAVVLLPVAVTVHLGRGCHPKVTNLHGAIPVNEDVASLAVGGGRRWEWRG